MKYQCPDMWDPNELLKELREYIAIRHFHAGVSDGSGNILLQDCAQCNLLKRIDAALQSAPPAQPSSETVGALWVTWMGKCIQPLVNLDGTPSDEQCQRLVISKDKFDEHIAPKIRDLYAHAQALATDE